MLRWHKKLCIKKRNLGNPNFPSFQLQHIFSKYNPSFSEVPCFQCFKPCSSAGLHSLLLSHGPSSFSYSSGSEAESHCSLGCQCLPRELWHAKCLLLLQLLQFHPTWLLLCHLANACLISWAGYLWVLMNSHPLRFCYTIKLNFWCRCRCAVERWVIS